MPCKRPNDIPGNFAEYWYTLRWSLHGEVRRTIVFLLYLAFATEKTMQDLSVIVIRDLHLHSLGLGMLGRYLTGRLFAFVRSSIDKLTMIFAN